MDTLEKEKQKLSNPQYFEGTLQLRNCGTDILDYVFKKNAQDKRNIITKQKKVANGWDLKFSSQKYLQQLGKHLTKTFPGDLKISRKLHSQDRVSNKKVWRVTVLFKQSPFRRGATIRFDDQDWTIEKISKDKAYIKNARTGKKEWQDLTNLTPA